MAKEKIVTPKRERSGRAECKLLDINKFSSWTDYVGEPKIDGCGAVFLVRNGLATVLSSTQLPLQNLGHLLDYLEVLAKHCPDWDNRFYDGEVLMSGMSQPEAQNVTSGLIQKHEEDPRAKDIHFHIWDTLSIKEYDNLECELIYTERKTVLNLLFLQLDEAGIKNTNHLLYQITGKEFTNKEEFLTLFNSYIATGNEGIVIKQKDGLYSYCKNNTFLKFKPHQEGDFKITGAVEGKGRLTGSLGKLLVEGFLQSDGNISPVRLNYSDVLINASPATFENVIGKQLWQDYLNGKLLGRVVEVKHEGITAHQNLKFAKYLRMRPDKENFNEKI